VVSSSAWCLLQHRFWRRFHGVVFRHRDNFSVYLSVSPVCSVVKWMAANLATWVRLAANLGIFFSYPSCPRRLLIPSSVYRLGVAVFFRVSGRRKPCAHHTLPCTVVFKNRWSSTSTMLICLYHTETVHFIYIISVNVSLLYLSNASGLFFTAFVYSADKFGLPHTKSAHLIVTCSPYRLCPNSSWRLRAEVVPAE
jgi:hypothetical protein